MVPTVTLGDGLTVSAMGFGAMVLSQSYGETDHAEGLATLNRCLDLGVAFIDTANVYGAGDNERLIANVLADRRDEVTLATKFGIAGNPAARAASGPSAGGPQARGDAAYVQQCIDESLQRLNTDVVDLYYLHRRDLSVPIEETVGAMAELVRAGKVRHLGLSEVTADELRAAVAVHPIAAVQSEYSLWTRNPEIAVLDACRSIGAAFVAFSPLARGFLTGALREAASLDAKDLRRSMPRFAAPAYAANLELLDEYAKLARAAHASMAQLALAWVLARGEHVVAIPGTACRAHLEENLGAAAVELDPDLTAQLDALINQSSVVGERYNAGTQAEIDTENF
jgi:aryl-alcohol dehydrogenase-like predicted oxidoreductase